MSGFQIRAAIGVRRTSAAAKLMLLLTIGAAPVYTQVGKPGPLPPDSPVTSASDASGLGEMVTLDRVVAIVNSDLILESDVDAEGRFAAFQPFSVPQPVSQESLIERLINRTLISQQMALQPSPPITDAQVDEELISLRKAIPRCVAYQCDTDAGWKKFVLEQGFTVDEMRERWRQRMSVLRFVDERFRMGIPVSQAEIDDYYKTQMLPEYKKVNSAAPAEATLSDRIKEILLQQRVEKLLDDWLTSLRAQGSVRILKPGEEAP